MLILEWRERKPDRGIMVESAWEVVEDVMTMAMEELDCQDGGEADESQNPIKYGQAKHTLSLKPSKKKA